MISTIDTTSISGLQAAYFPADEAYVTTSEKVIRTPLVRGHYLLGQIDRLRHLQADWDSYGADAPCAHAIQLLEDTCHCAIQMGLTPTAIMPSVEGGAGIVFRRGELHADIEFFNDGEIAALVSNGRGNAKAWAVKGDRITDAIRSIMGFLGEYTTSRIEA